MREEYTRTVSSIVLALCQYRYLTLAVKHSDIVLYCSTRAACRSALCSRIDPRTICWNYANRTQAWHVDRLHTVNIAGTFCQQWNILTPTHHQQLGLYDHLTWLPCWQACWWGQWFVRPRTRPVAYMRVRRTRGQVTHASLRRKTTARPRSVYKYTKSVAQLAERWSLAGELTLSCARPAADGWPLCG